MYYALTFDRVLSSSVPLGPKNTWSDWYLVPSSRPSVAPPSVKKTVIEIPGSNGIIDLTESLTGDVTYGQRTGSWEFIVMNEKPILWSELYSDILDYLHGQRVRVYLEDTLKSESDTSYPDYYYEGRIDVEAWDTQDNYSVISMNYNLDPFKYDRVAVSDRITVNSTSSWTTKTYTTKRMPVIPKFIVDTGGQNMKVRFKGISYDLSVGEQAVANIVFTEGSNQIQLQGNGTVTVSFRGGRL